jgi:nucleotide-binding universal stress UspA family protein
MTYKTILVYAEADATKDTQLHCAVGLADVFKSTLVGLAAETTPLVRLGSLAAHAAMGSSLVNSPLALMNENLAVAEANFRSAAGTRPLLWRTDWAPPTRALMEHARLADLIVVRRPDVIEPHRTVDPAALVIGCGRPVLLCPSELDYLAPGPVVVAWKNTREAHRAVADALPLLRRSQDVVILEVCSEVEVGAAALRTKDVVEALGRHGIEARAEVVANPRITTSEAILEQADQINAALIVAGAYGHTRLQEWVMGGVTAQMLKQDRFVLLSH